MRKPFVIILCLTVASLLFSACAAPATQPLTFRPAPWQSGEMSQYDVLSKTGEKLGTAAWTWQRSGNEWQQGYELTVNGVPDKGAVFLSDSLQSLRSWREVGGKRYDATYGDKTIEIKTTAVDGSVTTRTLPATADAIDNDVSLQLQRAMPLAANYATRYTDVIATTGGSAPILLSVTGAETVTVPAGTFPTWRVKMAIGSTPREGGYAQQPPYAMVKYLKSASGASFVLTSAGGTATEASQAGAAPVATPSTAAATSSSIPATMAPINWLLLALMVIVQLPFLIGLPILLGWVIKRRLGIGWAVFGWGALSFVLSQVVHIPLNSALGLIGTPRGVALWPPVLVGLAVGLSAAVCEEGTRLLVVGVFARKIRGWASGLQFGAGHGGAESIILGVLAAVNLGAILIARDLGPAGKLLPPDAVAQIQAAQGAFWGQSIATPLISALERIFALTLQLAMSVLVVQSVTRRRPLYFVAALALHTLVDAWVIWGRGFGIAGIEVGVAVLALVGLWIIWRLREQPAAPPSVLDSGTSNSPVPTAADLTERRLSPEELARAAERSRYE
jgi:uncharacterized membrane protein YhfC